MAASTWASFTPTAATSLARRWGGEHSRDLVPTDVCFVIRRPRSHPPKACENPTAATAPHPRQAVRELEQILGRPPDLVSPPPPVARMFE